MSYPVSRKFVLATTLVCTLLSQLSHSQEISLSKLSGTPELADFISSEDMRPISNLAQSMTKIESFIQRLPDDGEPASQRTEVYLGYDSTELHAIFLAFDDEPGLIRANISSRENFEGDDSVELIIDTFNAQRAAFAFRTNPVGIQWDARWTEGASRRGGFDTTLEAVWDSEGQLTNQGYAVKMSIPLRSLRFPEAEDQIWRVQVGRNIARLDEQNYWPHYSISKEGRLNQTALMSGITDVAPGNNTQIIPFIFAREIDALDPDATGGPMFNTKSEQDVGLDAKFIFNDAIVLDLTLNPDFSQVESDQPQVTINERFEVQFPERRPFFVENADFFATDSNLVFTRRIVDPEGGIRLTGKTGDYGFGAIMINDEAPGLNRAADDPLNGEKANIAILRGFRDFSAQNRVGFLITDRELGDGYNRVGSLDGRFKLNANWVTQMQAVATESEHHAGGEKTTGYQRNIAVNRSGRTFNNHTHYIATTKDFRTELGFANRYFKADTEGLHQRLNFNFYPDESTINSWGATLFPVYLQDMEGQKLFSQISASAEVKFATSQFSASIADYEEILRPQDFNGLASNQSYSYDDITLRYSNTVLESLNLQASIRDGKALNVVPRSGTMPGVANTRRVSVDALWRPIDRLRVANTYLDTQLETLSGTSIFTNRIMRSNWNYQFTREWSLRFIAQYDETDAGPATRLVDDENLNFDLLLRYVINPWSALYVGYNTNRSNFDIVDMEGERELVIANELRNDGEQFFVKFSYLFQR